MITGLQLGFTILFTILTMISLSNSIKIACTNCDDWSQMQGILSWIIFIVIWFMWFTLLYPNMWGTNH